MTRSEAGDKLSGDLLSEELNAHALELDDTPTEPLPILAVTNGLGSRLESKDIRIPTFDPEFDSTTEVAGFQRDFVWTKPQADNFWNPCSSECPCRGSSWSASQRERWADPCPGAQLLRTSADSRRPNGRLDGPRSRGVT